MEIEKIREEIDKKVKEIQRKREIHCPYCDSIMDMCDGGDDIVTYHGYPDEPVVRVECLECEEPFIVKELVKRTYETFLTIQEAEDEGKN